jgi:hypothetical protein
MTDYINDVEGAKDAVAHPLAYSHQASLKERVVAQERQARSWPPRTTADVYPADAGEGPSVPGNVVSVALALVDQLQTAMDEVRSLRDTLIGSPEKDNPASAQPLARGGLLGEVEVLQYRALERVIRIQQDIAAIRARLL